MKVNSKFSFVSQICSHSSSSFFTEMRNMGIELNASMSSQPEPNEDTRRSSAFNGASRDSATASRSSRATRNSTLGPGVQSTRDINGTHHIYNISVFDSRLRPNEAIQDAITRVAFGAFAVTGDYMRAQQRVSYRLQYWTDLNFPAIHSPESNVIVSKCKVLNQTALDVSKDGSILALLTAHENFDFEETFLTVFSLNPLVSNAAPLAKIPVGHNAISVSLSPSSGFVFVGYYNKHSTRSLFFRNFLNGPSLGEIFELDCKKPNAKQRLIPRKQLNQPSLSLNRDSRSRGGAGGSNDDNVGSVNCAAWFPSPGRGVVYGTTLGELIVCSPRRPKLARSSARTERLDIFCFSPKNETVRT